jgi:DNA-binding MarR family transcriptional regulator
MLGSRLSMNGIANNLVATGLLTRQPHPREARILLLALSEAGERRAASCRVGVEAVEARFSAPLTKATTACRQLR